MLISKQIEIDMAHRIPNHKSKCSNLHGHRYTIEAGVDGFLIQEKGDSSEGMVIDYSDLKSILMKNIDAKYDHNTCLYCEDPIVHLVDSIEKFQTKKIHVTKFIPTAENLAIHWFQIIDEQLKKKKIRLEFLKVFETPTSSALITRENYESL